MENIIASYGKELEQSRGFVRIPTPEGFHPLGVTWQMADGQGEGFYWVYAQKNLFAVKIHDFFYYEDTFMCFDKPGCLSISEYTSISGEELSPYRRLSAGCIKTFVGGSQPYRMIVHKNIPVKSISVELLPTYYERYLHQQYPEQYKHPSEIFREIDQVRDWPEMRRLFFELKNYTQNEGLASNLFFEAKVSECMALVLNYARQQEGRGRLISAADEQALQNVLAYINDHYATDLPLKRLAGIAYMGTTKLKTLFKAYTGLSITAYIQERRIAQAEHLLLETDLAIEQIARAVGYSTSSRFAVLFKRQCGLLPSAFKGLARKPPAAAAEKISERRKKTDRK